MEKGFYHASRGYWQTIGDVPPRILATYPDGTIEVPVKPGQDYELTEGVWVHSAPQVTAEMVTSERDRRIEALADGYTPTERETWPVQVQEAKAYKADNGTATPMLASLAAARAVTVDQMADRVLGLNASLAAATGQIMAAATVMLALDHIPTDFADDVHWPT